MQKKSLKLLALCSVAALMLVQNISACYASDDEDYNFSWLDPDKKIYVLQNRKYRKAEHGQLSLLGGLGLSETYRTAWQVNPRLGYWFNEDFGFEAFFTNRWNAQNNAFRALEQAAGTGTQPFIREMNSEVGVLLNWAPWYAKINVFNSILYFDWYFSFGLGTMSTSIGPGSKTDSTYASRWHDENLFAVYLGTGQLFHLSQTFDLRLDLLGHFYSASIFGGAPSANGQSTPTDKAIFSSFSFDAGIGIKL